MLTTHKIKKFNPNDIKEHRNILAVGRRGSGKSSLMADILYHLRDRFDYCMAMCPTQESAAFFRKIMPSCCIFNRFSQAKLELLLKTANELVVKGKPRSFLLILDDVFYDASVSRSNAFNELCCNGRHAHISCFLCVQHVTSIPPIARSSMDVVMACRSPVLADRIRLQKYFFGLLSTQDFEVLFDRCTQNFECCVLDNTQCTTDISQCIYWYKANVGLPDFQLCSKVFHVLQEKYQRDAGSGPTLDEQESMDRANKKTKICVLKEDNEENEDSEVR
jgi:hypothetical protein